MKSGTPSQPIMSSASSHRIMVGNWSLACKKEGELQIHNSDGQQVNYRKKDINLWIILPWSFFFV